MTRFSVQPRIADITLTPRVTDGVSLIRQDYRPLPILVSQTGDNKEDGIVKKDAESATEFSGGAALELPRRPLRVVIVEDEMIISMDLQMLLEDLEAEVVGTAMSADDADALVAAHRPDVVTMDINIKGDRDGVTAANEIFAKYGVRSIFVSAYGDAGTRARAEPAKPFGWVRKPIEKADLEEVLRLVDRRDM